MSPVTSTSRFPGSRSLIVYGTVVNLVPASTTFFGLFKKSAMVKMTLDAGDDEKYRHAKLASHERRRELQDPPTPAGQFIIVGWDREDALPEVGTRIRMTFAYAAPLETWIGAIPMSLQDLSVIPTNRVVA